MKNVKNILGLFLLLVIVVSTSCDKDDEEEPQVEPLAIGDFHQGGVVFYLDETGEHGLISAVLDQSFEAEWGCPSLISFGAKGLVIGTGAQNTIDIVSACNENNIAAALCDQLELNEFDDWFLPSKDELDSLYNHRTIVNETAIDNGGNVLNGGEYWSSSHYLDNTVWIQSFNAGNQFGTTKDTEHFVRAIRSF